MKFDIEHLNHLAERLDYKPDSQQHKDNLSDYCTSDRMMAIAEAFRALEQRAEAAEALNKHLELAVRKAEGVSETLRRRAEAAESALTEKPQPVAVVVGKLGAGIRATAFEAAPRPDLGQLLYDGPAAPVKLPVSQRLDGNGYGYYFDMNDVFTALEDAGIKFEVQK